MEQEVRTPPQCLEAEQALLGAILVNNRALEKVVEFLQPFHFANAAHARIYEALLTLIERGQTVDPLVLKQYFAKDEDLAQIGGQEYIVQLAAAGATGVNVAEYGQQIVDRYMRRQLVNIGSDVVQSAFEFSLDDDSATQIQRAETRLYDLATALDADKGPQPVQIALKGVLERAQNALHDSKGLSGLSTGFCDLDKKLGGLQDSDLIILAARPGMGKTALATCIATNVATNFKKENDAGAPKKSVAFFSLEMSAEQLSERILSAAAEVNAQALRTGRISSDKFDSLASYMAALSELPLQIDETPMITVTSIKNRARHLQRQKDTGLGLIVIDYVQLIASLKKTDNRVQELSEITRQLKIMAKELGVPVLALSQLSREVEKRDKKEPQLSDLRDSGSIEQDADVVLFIYREGYYGKTDKVIKGEKEKRADFDARSQQADEQPVDNKRADVIIAKHRHGPTGRVTLRFDSDYTKFTSLDEHH